MNRNEAIEGINDKLKDLKYYANHMGEVLKSVNYFINELEKQSEKVEDKKYYAKVKGWELIENSKVKGWQLIENSKAMYWNYYEKADAVFISTSENTDKFKAILTKPEWAEIGITEENADFEEVER